MNMLKGAVTALLASLLVALAFAYGFRLPIPLGGMLGPFGDLSPYNLGFEDVLRSVFAAWVFYGLLGGFVVLSAVGAIAGHVAGRKYAGSGLENRRIVLYAALAGVLPVAALAVLDYVIGPW